MVSAGPVIMEGGEQTTPPSPEQREPLLRTKLFSPPPRPNRVTRHRLIDRLNSNLDKALILISAPAGYGKTTLVSSWLRESDVPSSWLSLDEDDNDPIRFLQYFITALQKIVPAIRPEWLGMFQGRQTTPTIALMNLILNEISEGAAPFVLVLDDFHTLHSQPVLDIFTHLLEHMPPQMHIVLLSRTDPPIPLSRLRARNQLIDIRAEQLRFTRGEVAKFLNEGMALKLSSDDIISLEERTEGWIAGLQLAAISMLGGVDVHGFVSAFAGSHYYIMDYLAEEVLRLQTETIRSFLLQSSILDRICGSLCEAVIEADLSGASKGQAMLETLEQKNLFIIPLDSERRWYRYHHLFADVLNRRLEQLYPHLLPDLHRRASGWYEQNGLISDAIRHSLIAGDRDRAARLVDQNGCVLLMRGEVTNLLHWIEAVEPYSQTHPWIAIQKAWSLCLTGQLERVEGPLQIAGQLISTLESTDEVRTMCGAVTAARAFRANLQGATRMAADFARQALDDLPVSSDFSCSLRSVATSILGDASWLEGNLVDARHAYTDAARISQAAGDIYTTLIANTNLADVLMEQGDLHLAARIYSESLQMAKRPDGQILPLADSLYFGLSNITYEWSRLETAAQYVQQCIELCQGWGNSNLLAKGYGLLARLERARCNPENAQKAMRAAEELAREQRLSPRQSEWVRLASAEWWITQGRLESAIQLVQQSGVTIEDFLSDSEIPYSREPEGLLLIRLHLAQGDPEAALSLAERLLPVAEAAERTGRVIEILVLQSLALQRGKETGKALIVLDKALALAQPEGYRRVFLDEGERMAKLLFQAKSQRMGPGYASELLSALDKDSGTEQPLAQHLIEPLTRRELELLKLIEAGSSNQDIADRLVISIPTVKRHISNIYAKLGATSRTQAVSLGRELRLIE